MLKAVALHGIVVLHIAMALACPEPVLAAASSTIDTPTSAGATSLSARIRHVVGGILGHARWPRQPEHLQLCLTGASRYEQALMDVPLPGAPPMASQTLPFDSPQLLTQCHAVYIGTLATPQRTRLVASLVGRPILTIREQGGTCVDGTLFCLHIRDDAIFFEINLDSVARSGLRIDPRVLAVPHTDPLPAQGH
ncbi:YfiR family protein [Corticibacter populi]|uniref:YfiR family protein n=1 Tax=Corticibacter populi TaxID=1550736 RepID=UPI0010E37B21|nr:YfiR family protein [Corticibacter populi]RZS30688.1 uncharacterized protein DUF4154 [Corticibacter populi]